MYKLPVPKFLDLYNENGLLHLKTKRVLGIYLEDIASKNATNAHRAFFACVSAVLSSGNVSTNLESTSPSACKREFGLGVSIR
jgi:hypothetical protein